MALRLIEMVLKETDAEALHDLLKEHTLLEHRQLRCSDGDVLVRILLDAEHSEAVLDVLATRYGGEHENRVLILPVEATLPRIEPIPDTTPPPPVTEDKPPARIGREELYEDIKDATRCTRVYLAMVVLSTIVAAIGLYYNSVTIIIGAMVIAPLLGPNMAMALATTLGDLPLLWQGLRTNLAGIATVMVLSVIIGVLLKANPATSELATRDSVALGDVVVALASGAAGALAFTTGASAILIGVMVAVALLPPLVAFGLLLGGGHPALATGAFSLFLMNLICINLAGVGTFLLQGIRPATWWEEKRATKATRIAVGLWVALLGELVGLIVLMQS